MEPLLKANEMCDHGLGAVSAARHGPQALRISS